MNTQPIVAVIGAGPAGIFAAEELAKHNVRVMLINRDIKPGGLAEYGIFFDKFKMKDGLRNQFRKMLKNRLIEYFGNLTIGENGNMTLPQLQALGFDGVLVAVGAQGTKWLGLPGEALKGVYHAKDIVYHYNKLPPYGKEDYPIGKRVAIIGAGNVMIDIANWLINYLKVKEVVILVRRDPGSVKFSRKEIKPLLKNIDRVALMAEIERTRPLIETFEIDANKAFAIIRPSEKGEFPTDSNTQFRFKFLASVKCFLGDGQSDLIGVELENNTLKRNPDGSLSASGLGTTQVLEIDTAIFAIGDRVDDQFGLPLADYEFAKNPSPNFPINDISYEAFDPATDQVIDGVFLAGWARNASSGLVGTARKDGKNGALAMLRFLESKTGSSTANAETISRILLAPPSRVVSKKQWQLLDAFELAQAQKYGTAEAKVLSNIDMLQQIHEMELASAETH
ncbi:MAG: ferredoxin--NADP+ reductase [Cellvibrionaceae bacterium]|jgi:ferredoxin--NADP+ reductase